MNWRDEKRTRRHEFVRRRDEDFVQDLTAYLSFLLLGTSCLGRPSGDVPCASEIWLAVSRSGSDKKRRNRLQ